MPEADFRAVSSTTAATLANTDAAGQSAIAAINSASTGAINFARIAGVAPSTMTLNPQAGDYTLLAADASGVLIQMSKGSAAQLSIPTDATHDFAVGTTVNVIATGAGPITIAAADGGTTTVVSTGATAASPVLRVQYSSATLVKVAANSWYVIGDVK